MKNIYYSLTIALSFFLLISCTGTTDSSSIYQLSTSSEPAEAGTVTPSSKQMDAGSSVEISASANQDWIFQSWQGGHSGSSNPATVTMDKDKQITALFVKVEFALNKEIEGEGNIYERIIHQKTTHHSPGTIVEVVAVPNKGWRFLNWAEDLDGNENPVSLNIDGEKTVKAVFVRKDYDLTIEVEGVGAVSEEVIQAKTTEYPYQTIVELNGSAGDGWMFDRWEGDLSGSDNPTQITITESKNVKAVFVRQSYNLNININGEGTVNENLISGTETDGKYAYESEVELTAEPEVGFQFKSWIGDIESTENPLMVTVAGNTEITAVFEEADYSLTIEIQGEGEVKQEIVQSKSTTYPGGTEVMLTALSDGDWRFVGWKEDATGTESEIIVTIDRNKTIIAIFDDGNFEGGDGSLEYPYEVANVEQLQEIHNYTDKNFVQVNDIDAIETQNWNAGKGFAPIGDNVIKFTGSYINNGFKISNLTINREDENHIGLFGYVGSATTMSLILEQVNIKGGNNVGGIAGNFDQGTILDSHVNGLIEGSYAVGGLVGRTGSMGIYINNSSSNVEIQGSNSVGGIVGLVLWYVSYIDGVYSNASIVGNSNIGVLIGSNRGEVSNSYATGNVNGQKAIAGIIGYNNDQGKVFNSFSAVTVSGLEDVGGLIGINAGTINSSFWNSEVSNQSSAVGKGPSTGASGLSTSQMQGLPAQENMPAFDWEEIWKTVTGNYPILRWQEE